MKRRFYRRSALGAAAVALVASVVIPPESPAHAVFVDPGAVATSFRTVDSVPMAFAGIEAGNEHTLAWNSLGELYAWGNNASGELGQGDDIERWVPTLVTLPPGERVIATSGGLGTSIALTASRNVYTWGGDVSAGSTPTRVAGLPDDVVGVSTGGYFFLAWTEDGKLYSWGNNGGGRLGRPTGSGAMIPARVTAQGMDTRFVEGASAGRIHGVAWSDDGTFIAGWGGTASEYAGAGGRTFLNVPAQGIAGMSAGNTTNLAWTADGRLFQDISPRGTLEQNTLLAGVDVIAATPGVPGEVFGEVTSFFAWTAEGDVYSWGRNGSGQLGLGDTDNRADPTPVPLANLAHPIHIAAGADHTMYLQTDGSYAYTGSNSLVGVSGESRTTFTDPFFLQLWPKPFSPGAS